MSGSLNLELIKVAEQYLATMRNYTPMIRSVTTDDLVGKNVYFKMENVNKTGSFKFRGANFKLSRLSAEKLVNGVVSASAGNHAQGVAHAAARMNVKSTIFMPEETPLSKVNATKSYGAEVVLTGESVQDAYEASIKRQLKTGAAHIHPYNDYEIMAGQGTIALEMLEQESKLDTLIVPIGGGGLISGIAIAAKSIKPEIKIIGVQAAGTAPVNQSDLQHIDTIADGISVKHPGDLTVPIIDQYVDDIITVTEQEIAASIIYMLERNKTLVEGAGAAALAALFANNNDIQSSHCGVIITGGNIDISTFPIVQKLAKQGQLKKSECT